jgi:hypothetical protein
MGMNLIKVSMHVYKYHNDTSVQLIALYSYPYLNQQKPLFLPITAYTLYTTKLEIRAK